MIKAISRQTTIFSTDRSTQCYQALIDNAIDRRGMRLVHAFRSTPNLHPVSYIFSVKQVAGFVFTFVKQFESKFLFLDRFEWWICGNMHVDSNELWIQMNNISSNPIQQ